jgi:hypothetical protein
MALVSRLFRGVPALEACLVRDSAHLTLGTVGPHIPRIQKALLLIEGVIVSSNEVTAGLYGPSTAAAVLAYKKQRKIINKSYQSQADNIVGKMTIQSLDDEVSVAEGPLRSCPCGDPVTARGGLQVRSQVRGVTGTQANFGVELKVGYHFALRPGKTFGGSLRALRLKGVVETHAVALLAPWGMTLKPTMIGSFEFPFSVNPNAPADVQSLRDAAEKAAKSAPNVLRVIFCRFDDNAQEFGVSGGPAYGGTGFAPFVVLNVLKLRLDGGTMTHEMIHVSDDKLFSNQAHDKESEFPQSVFCSQEGRTEIRRPHAEALSKAFFGK